MNLEYRDSLPSSNTDLNHQKTDEEIFELFQEGNVDALGVIYDRYGLLVYRLIYRMLNNSQEAEDLTQEIFISLQKKPNYNPQKSSFYTYLMMITRSRTIDRLRSKRYHSSLFLKKDKIKDLIDRQNYVNPLEMATIDERANQVRNALDNLSLNQRRVLELSYYEGLSQSEIAKRLNLPLGTVKTHSRRGLLKLKQNLQNLVN